MFSGVVSMLLLLLCISYGIQPLTTKDGFGFIFSSDDDPTIREVTIDGSSVSEAVPNKGGFRAKFINEDLNFVFSDSIIKNGDLTTSDDGWKNTGTFDASAGRDGTGAICLSTGQSAYQSFYFNESNKNSYGIKISGWSKAANANGNEDYDYSLYMDIGYEDGTYDWSINVQFPVGTHGYVYRERYHEFKKTVKYFNFRFFYRKGHTTGYACFDDISVQLYESPPISGGSVTATNESSYRQISTVQDSKLTVDYTAKDHHIQVNGILESLSPMINKNRSVTLSFSVPVNVSGDWVWGSGLGNTKLGENGSGSGSLKYSFDAFSIDRILVAGISNDRTGIGIGIKPGSVFAFRFTCNGGTGLLTISMEFALTPVSRVANSAWFEFSLFKLDYPTTTEAFRSALDKYCKKVYADIYMQRVILDQGLWIVTDSPSYVEGWEDFGFKFYEDPTDIVFSTNNSMWNYPYIEPPVLHHSFYSVDPDEEFKMIEECNTTKCNVTYVSYITDSNGKIYYKLENKTWNNGTLIPVNGNPNIPGELNVCKYQLDKVDERYKSESNDSRIDGIYVDSIEASVNTLDYRSENFKYLGATPIYDNNNIPCTQFGAWTYDFLEALAQKLRTEKGPEVTIMGNTAYERFGHFAPFIDVPGIETNWLRDDVYTSLPHSTLFYFRLNSFQKPYLFLQNSDFRKWTKDMSDDYMQKSLQYGIWPGFHSDNAAGVKYFRNPEFYNRDRLLFKKYIPVLKAITSQGWEPITCTASTEINPKNDSNAVLYVERWGGGNNELPIYFTMRVETNKTMAKYNVTIDLECLGVKKKDNMQIYVMEICQKNKTFNLVNNAYFEFEFENEITYVFKVEESEWNAASSTECKWHLLITLVMLFFCFFEK